MMSSLDWEILEDRTRTPVSHSHPSDAPGKPHCVCRVSSWGSRARLIVNNLGVGLPFLQSYSGELNPHMSCLLEGPHFLKWPWTGEQQGNLEGKCSLSQVSWCLWGRQIGSELREIPVGASWHFVGHRGPLYTFLWQVVEDKDQAGTSFSARWLFNFLGCVSFQNFFRQMRGTSSSGIWFCGSQCGAQHKATSLGCWGRWGRGWAETGGLPKAQALPAVTAYRFPSRQRWQKVSKPKIPWRLSLNTSNKIEWLLGRGQLRNACRLPTESPANLRKMDRGFFGCLCFKMSPFLLHPGKRTFLEACDWWVTTSGSE